MLLSGAVTTKVESGAMSVNVAINGVAADRTGEVEREVHKAVEDSIRNLLAQLKAERNYESRLGYV